MRKVIIEVPDEYCNECMCFRTWEWQDAFVRYYTCCHFECSLGIDESQIHDEHKDCFGRNYQLKEYKALPCDRCLKETK